MNVKRLFAIVVIFTALIAPLRSQQTQAVEYRLENFDSAAKFALYSGGGWRSYIDPKYVVQSFEELEQRVGQLPLGTKLYWNALKRDPSDKPILFSDGQFDQFAKFCRDHDVELLLIPSSQGIVQDESQEPRQPLFVIRERLYTPSTAFCPVGKAVYGISYSVISVFPDKRGSETIWSVLPCSDAVRAIEWAVSANAKTNDFALSPDALAELRSFLDRPAVNSLRDFMNAGYGGGDYEIEIRRSSGVQRIPVISLMPEHDELKHDPTLIQVICKAKQIAGDERPAWCPN